MKPTRFFALSCLAALILPAAALAGYSALGSGFIGTLQVNDHQLPTRAAVPLAGLATLSLFAVLGGLALLVSRQLAAAKRNAITALLLVASLAAWVAVLTW